MKTTMKLLASLIVSGVLLAACSSRTTVESDLGIKGAPAWVNEGSQALNDGKNRFFRGIGSAPKMSDVSLQRATADNRARAEVAQLFSSYVDVVAKDYSAAIADDNDSISEQVVSRTIKNVTQVSLTGAAIIARWQDRNSGAVYSLAELDMNKVKTLMGAAKEMDGSVKSFVEREADNIFDSVSQEK